MFGFIVLVVLLEKIGVPKEIIKVRMTMYGLFIKVAGVLKTVRVDEVRRRDVSLDEEFAGIADELLVEFFPFAGLVRFCIQELFLVVAEFFCLDV